MKELFHLIILLEEALDEEEVVQQLKNKYKELKKDKELVSLLKRYHQSNDEELREELLNSRDIRTVKKLEAELNYLILEINQDFKDLKDKRGCFM